MKKYHSSDEVTITFLQSKELKAYAASKDVEIYYDKEHKHFKLQFSKHTPKSTDDDFIEYYYGGKGELHYVCNYQVDEVGEDDVEHWISGKNEVIELIDTVAEYRYKKGANNVKQ